MLCSKNVKSAQSQTPPLYVTHSPVLSSKFVLYRPGLVGAGAVSCACGIKQTALLWSECGRLTVYRKGINDGCGWRLRRPVSAGRARTFRHGSRRLVAATADAEAQQQHRDCHAETDQHAEAQVDGVGAGRQTVQGDEQEGD